MRRLLTILGTCLILLLVLGGALPASADVEVGAELLVNGGFEKLDDPSRPAGWRWFGGAHVRREKGNTWVELDRYGSVDQEVAIDPNWMKLTVRFRMRVTGIKRGDDGWKNARLAMQWVDAAGKHVDPWPNVVWAEGTTGWKEYKRVFLIPQGAAKLQFSPSMFGRPGGKVEFDDLSVTLLRKRSTKPEDLPAPAGYETAWGLADAARLRSAARERICLNGLWRFLPVPDGKAAAPPKGTPGWGWFKVPGVWPRQVDGGAQEILLSPWMEDRTDLAALDQAWYLRELTVPASWSSRRVAVDFGLVQTHARVFLDGRPAGEVFFPGGEVDLTKLVRPGATQTLAVLVTARPLAAETTAFMAPDRVLKDKASVKLRGLTGDVYLTSRPAGEHLADVRITTSVKHSVLRADVKIGLWAGGSRVLRGRVLEGGKVVKEFTSGLLIPGQLQGGLACVTTRWVDAKHWDTHTPQNVYDLVLRLESPHGSGAIDESLPIRFGFREFRIDGRDFRLNGKRIHLRALNVRNISSEAGLACIETGRTTCRRMKEYGFNFFIVGNYDFRPGAVSDMDSLFRAADEAGVLASFSLPHVKDFAWKLDDPAQAKRYRALCEYLIRRVRHHPSIVMYAMNHNATGYKGDQNPLRIDGIFSPDDPKFGGSPNRNRTQARLSERIARELDPTRPIYHHQSGHLGAMHCINIYLNWAPMQERSDWLEHWASRGVKPLFFVEWGLPHVSSWSSYRGPHFIWRTEAYQSLWDAEFNAEYLGDAAYKPTPARIKSREHEEDLWSRGKPFAWSHLIRHFSRAEKDHTRIKAMFADDNWRCLRAWGISAMLPWDQGNLWKQAQGFQGGTRRVTYAPGRLHRPGIVADRLKASESYLYHPDANQLAPTVLGESFLRWNRPLCAFIGGGPDANDFTDKAHNVLPGETLRKQIVILNDTREAAPCRYACWFLPAGEWTELRSKGKMPRPQYRGGLTVEPGARRNVRIDVRLPAGARPGRYEIVAEVDFGPGGKQTDTFTVDVLDKPAPISLAKHLALFDPKGMTAKVLDSLGVKYEKIAADADVSKYGILVIGREAIGLTNKLPDLSAVRDGLGVLIFEQTAQTLTHRLGFRVNVHGLRRVFRRARWHETMNGIPHCALHDWRGSATLVPSHLPIEGIEKDNPRWRWCGFSNTRVWRCGNRGCVASVLIEKPPVGDFRPLLDGGFDLQYAPLLEHVEGKGRVVFCQLDVTGRTETDPAAMQICRALLTDLASPKPTRFANRRKVYHVGGAKGADLLRRLGVPFSPWRPDRKGPDSLREKIDALLVVTPGAEDLPPLGRDTYVLGATFFLGLSSKEITRLWPGVIEAKPQVSSYGTPDVVLCDDPGSEFLSPAERSWRGKVSFDALNERGSFETSVRKKTSDEKLSGLAQLCQVAPWMLDVKAKPYLRTTYRRNVFLVSRLLHNYGAPAKTPLLERLAKPAGVPEFVLPGKWVGRPDEKGAGRKAAWFQPTFDDAKWKPIRVPGVFDEQYPGLTRAYNGLFWYRLRFRVPANLKKDGLSLHLGAVDDESWVWLNGKFLGEVTKKTHPKDYWAVPRTCAISPGLLKTDGENVLVVLVNDTYQTGGIRGVPALTAPGAWLDSYYVQEPVADDDPYRYYRW